MPNISLYNRQKTLEYADKWALSRNPRYYDFSEIGGDCTNFASQCIYAGSGIMNFTPTHGWYYVNSFNRSPSWTAVAFLYNFLVTNSYKGPFAQVCDISKIELGDLIQLGNSSGRFYHSLILTSLNGQPGEDTIYISTHTMDSHNRPLNSYIYDRIRFLHIEGVYK